MVDNVTFAPALTICESGNAVMLGAVASGFTVSVTVELTMEPTVLGDHDRIVASVCPL